jgi:hypothetical protein
MVGFALETHMHKPVEIKALPDFRIWLRFEDGVEGVVDLSHLTGRGVFSLWNDPSVFQGVHLGSHGELVWNEDVDLCPDSLYMKLTGKAPEEVFPNLARTAVGA